MSARINNIAYWTATGILAFFIASGGVAEILRLPAVEAGMTLIGYPPYFVSILGVWKLLGTVAILAPGMPRIKEWAYAGLFFNVTGAAASHAFANDYGVGAYHIFVNLAFAVLVVISWYFRPPSRVVGQLFSAKTNGTYLSP